jgi:SAM-dependent methyltransferase
MLALLAADPVTYVRGPHRLLLSPPTPFGTGIYTVSDLDGGRTGWYYDWGELVGLERPTAKRVALLGMGGGEMLRAARRTLPDAELVGVELDPEIAALAVRDFGVERLGVKVVVADARGWLTMQPSSSVDVLMVDVYLGDELPADFRSPGFFAECRRVVGPKGAVLQNVWGPGLLEPVAKNMHRGGFDEVTSIDVGKGNVLVWAGALPVTTGPEWLQLAQRRQM